VESIKLHKLHTSLCTLTGLSALSHVYQMAQNNVQESCTVTDEENRIDWLPYELIEMIVMRAAGHLFISLHSGNTECGIIDVVRNVDLQKIQ